MIRTQPVATTPIVHHLLARPSPASIRRVAPRSVSTLELDRTLRSARPLLHPVSAQALWSLLALAEAGRFRCLGYAEIWDYAAHCLGCSRLQTRELLWLARGLAFLPLCEQAYLAGALSWPELREVLQVATPDNERRWLDLALALPAPELTERVRQELAARRLEGQPATFYSLGVGPLLGAITPGFLA